MNVKLPNGAINWAKADPILIRMHNGGRPPADIGIEIGISTDTVYKRLHTLNKQGKVVYPNNKRRLTTAAEKAAIISEYPTCDTNELADRLGMTRKQLSLLAQSLGVLRDPAAASEQLSRAAAMSAKKRRGQGLPGSFNQTTVIRNANSEAKHGKVVGTTAHGVVRRNGNVTTHEMR